ncbi:GntR family transcriptional regulator [Aurantivibrio infirmus]
MHIQINQVDGVAIYQQIINQIKYLIASGTLQVGEELPAIRALAERLVINPNTVARAYRELQIEGYLIKKGTKGTYVSDTSSPMDHSIQLKVLKEKIDSLLTDAEHMNVGIDEIKILLDEQAKLMGFTNEKKLKRGA